jgi:transcription elongation factor Elf1
MSVASLPTPAEFDELVLSQAKKVLDQALQLAGYDGEHLYRPIRYEDMPRSFKVYEPALQRALPKGERHAFSGRTRSYEFLHSWLNHSCPVCGAAKESVCWDLGDKHVEYFCRECKHETTFTSQREFEADAVYRQWNGVQDQEEIYAKEQRQRMLRTRI